MKKLLLMVFALAMVAWFWVYANKTEKPTQTPGATVTVIPSQTRSSSHTTSQSLFVPYWSITAKTTLPTYDTYIYFGVTPTNSGINTEDAGYLKLPQFTAVTNKNETTLLTLRMLNSTNNSAILKDTEKQKKIIAETINLAKKEGFDGIVLDLEMSALPFDSLIKQINAFVKDFSTTAKQQQLQFAMTMYGDTFYRIRPFDVKTLAGYTDQMMIMAYDLHKANGNPGPNFPLAGKDQYGYDYSKLSEQFLEAVPAEKLAVIFGMYGYDWQVDDKNISQGVGKATSLSDIRHQIVGNCTALQCVIKKDSLSSETMITYIDADNKKHIVWYENNDSTSTKQQYLQSRGITNFSYWAYSYF